MLAGKRALVTGSDSGLGYAIAEALARDGADIVLNGIGSEADGRAAASRLAEATGRSVRFFRVNLAEPAAIERMMAETGAVDILVNNAVVRHFEPVERLPTSAWDQALAVNLSAAFHTTRLAIPGMRGKSWGRIINVSSVFGHRADRNRVGYVTTKTALLGLTRAVALELAEAGITCNAICPGTVPTPPIVGRIAETAAAKGIPLAEAEHAYIADRHPTGRFVAAENVGRLATFLCGPAGDDITGSVFPIDGGWLAQR